MKADTRVLTKKQMLVYILDAEGNTPTEIAKRTGLSVSRVSNVKKRLRDLGFQPAVYRSLQRRLDETSAAPVERSPLEPEDDELPDADEPVMVVSRCSCGLALPCYHAPVSPFVNSAGYDPAAGGEKEMIGYRSWKKGGDGNSRPSSRR